MAWYSKSNLFNVLFKKCETLTSDHTYNIFKHNFYKINKIKYEQVTSKNE